MDKGINEFKIQEDEVEQIKWFTKEELENELKNNPNKFVGSMKKYFELFKNLSS